MTSPPLLGKRVLLVGATGILGRVHSQALVKAGARVVLADLPSTDVKSLAEQLSSDCRAVSIDIGSEKSVIEAIAAAEAEFEGLDCVVSNAAMTGEGLMGLGDPFAAFETSSLETWRRVINVNLTGSFLVAREGGKALLRGGGGSMVLVSSIYGIVAPDHRIYEDQPFKSFASYSASKAGIIGLARWLATWWADKGIRVNCLVPGGVYNDHCDTFAAAYGARVPMGRMARRDEMSGGLIYLLGDGASYVTGQVLTIDGGMSAW